jgi:hypothetical protein
MTTAPSGTRNMIATENYPYPIHRRKGNQRL